MPDEATNPDIFTPHDGRPMAPPPPRGPPGVRPPEARAGGPRSGPAPGGMGRPGPALSRLAGSHARGLSQVGNFAGACRSTRSDRTPGSRSRRQPGVCSSRRGCWRNRCASFFALGQDAASVAPRVPRDALGDRRLGARRRGDRPAGPGAAVSRSPGAGHASARSGSRCGHAVAADRDAALRVPRRGLGRPDLRRVRTALLAAGGHRRRRGRDPPVHPPGARPDHDDHARRPGGRLAADARLGRRRGRRHARRARAARTAT